MSNSISPRNKKNHPSVITLVARLIYGVYTFFIALPIFIITSTLTALTTVIGCRLAMDTSGATIQANGGHGLLSVCSSYP